MSAELIREASDILILNGHDGLANKLRALAARMEAAEGFEIKRNDAGQVYLDLPYAAWMMDNIGAKLYLHPADDAMDAQRYRWLAPRLIAADFDWSETGKSVLIFDFPLNVGVGGNCDMNIDAAITAERKE